MIKMPNDNSGTVSNLELLTFFETLKKCLEDNKDKTAE